MSRYLALCGFVPSVGTSLVCLFVCLFVVSAFPYYVEKVVKGVIVEDYSPLEPVFTTTPIVRLAFVVLLDKYIPLLALRYSRPCISITETSVWQCLVYKKLI